MPKVLEYPRSSFKNGMEIAEAVYSLGGKCDEETCASKLGKKTSGAFSKKISAAVKHGLILTNKGELVISDLFKSIKNAYDENESAKFLREAFFNATTYAKVYDRFKGKELPIDILDKLLIREYQVKENDATVIAKYLIEGLKFLNLISTDNKVIGSNNEIEGVENQKDKPINPSINDLKVENDGVLEPKPIQPIVKKASNSFEINVTGPGINSSIEINNEDDLLILNAIIAKIKKSF